MTDAFAASQVLGIPAGLFLSNHWSWHVSFAALIVLSIAGGIRVILMALLAYVCIRYRAREHDRRSGTAAGLRQH